MTLGTKRFDLARFGSKKCSTFARFSYFKKDGSIREARGTLNPLLIPENKMPRNGFETDNGTPAGTFAYYDIDAGDWRSFRLDNFIGFVEQMA